MNRPQLDAKTLIPKKVASIAEEAELLQISFGHRIHAKEINKYTKDVNQEYVLRLTNMYVTLIFRKHS